MITIPIIAITLIKSFLFSWFLTHFKPLEIGLDLLGDNLLTNIIKLMTTCLMCCSFWTTLYLTHNIFIASGMSMFGFFWDKFIGPIERKVKLN